MHNEPAALARHQQQVMKQIEQIVHSAFGAAMSLLAPGYKATVLFTFKGRPERDIVMTQAAFEDVLSSMIAKATPAQVSALRNADVSSNKALDSGPTPEDRLTAVRMAMRFLPHMPATSIFREHMTKALSQEVPSTAPVTTVEPVSDGPRDGLDEGEQPKPPLDVCPNCGSTNIYKPLGGRHFMCLGCDCDITECVQ
jgi:hypothetical protein